MSEHQLCIAGGALAGDAVAGRNSRRAPDGIGSCVPIALGGSTRMVPSAAIRDV